MPLNIDQICSFCCESVPEKVYPTYQIQLSCLMRELLQGILSHEEVYGCVCYEFALNDIRTALRILERDANGVFTGTYKFLDSLTGAIVDVADIVDCPELDCSYFTGV